jgi:hypothetical protein
VDHLSSCLASCSNSSCNELFVRFILTVRSSGRYRTERTKYDVSGRLPHITSLLKMENFRQTGVVREFLTIFILENLYGKLIARWWSSQKSTSVIIINDDFVCNTCLPYTSNRSRDINVSYLICDGGHLTLAAMGFHRMKHHRSIPLP